MVRQTSIGFKSKGLDLEGVISIPDGLPPLFMGTVVCHPHPLFGGSMDNVVVTAICQALNQRGIVSLRFNFRGVGDSEGSFSNGKEEQEDLKAALDVLKNWPGIDKSRLAIAGYSFGASVMLSGLPKYKDARALAFVSPPISAVKGSAAHKDKRPKLFLAGDRDKIAPPSQLEEALQEVSPPMEYHTLPGADHSLRGHESEVAEMVAEFLAAATLHKKTKG